MNIISNIPKDGEMSKEVITSEVELKALLSLPVVKLQNLDFLINRENKTIDLKISFNNHMSLIFVNVQGVELTDQFNYGNVEDEYYIDIRDISSSQLEHISWEFDEYENNSLHFFCESIYRESF